MNSFLFQELLDATGARLVRGDGAGRLRGVSTDTRTLTEGQLYLALAGPNFDGNHFAADACRRGAGGLLLRATDDPREAEQFAELPGHAPLATVADPLAALSALAAWHRARLDVPVLGITGSCGKTTTKNMVLELLADHLTVVASPASFNNEIGVPHTLLLADGSTDVLVVEMGTNAPGEIQALCRTARPTCAIITNVGASHLEGLGSVEGVAREKGELAAAVPPDGFVVLNADCRWTPLLRSLSSATVITFSIDGSGDLNASDVWFHSGGTTFTLDGTLDGTAEVTVPLLGLHSVQNLLAAMAACRGLGLELDQVLSSVGRLRAGRQRLEPLEVGGLTLLDDTYNANPESARASVRVLAGLHGYERRVLVMGEMHELGEASEELQREVGLHAARAGVDLLVTVGAGAAPTAVGALAEGLGGDRVVPIASLEVALATLPGLLAKGDVVLVKGSRAAGLERLVQRLVLHFGTADNEQTEGTEGTGETGETGETEGTGEPGGTEQIAASGGRGADGH